MTTTPEEYLAKAADAEAQLADAKTEAERTRLKRAHGVYLKLSHPRRRGRRTRRDARRAEDPAGKAAGVVPAKGPGLDVQSSAGGLTPISSPPLAGGQ